MQEHFVTYLHFADNNIKTMAKELSQASANAKPQNHIDDKKEACKTYQEQTKLLVTLASAFILVPVVFFEKINFAGGKGITMESLFISSVLMGYVVFGSITGTQRVGEYDTDRPAIRLFSFLQIGMFLIGMAFLFNLIINSTDQKKTVEEKEIKIIHKGDTTIAKGNF